MFKTFATYLKLAFGVAFVLVIAGFVANYFLLFFIAYAIYAIAHHESAQHQPDPRDSQR